MPAPYFDGVALNLAAIYIAGMTQTELDALWALGIVGASPQGWEAADNGDTHALVDQARDALWARISPNGTWVELPGLAPSQA